MAGVIDQTRPTICDERAIPSGTWESWFGWYSLLLDEKVANCFKQLHDNPLLHSELNPIPNCPSAFNLISCVQDALPVETQLAMASAQVILGLIPTLISTLSPSVGEISMLSSSTTYP